MLPLVLTASAALSACTVSSPEIFHAGVISSREMHEGVDWVSSNGNTVLFSRALGDFSTSHLYAAKKKDYVWDVERLNLSTGPYDAGLALSSDKTEIAFTSTRAGDENPEGDWNIWHAGVRMQNDDFYFDIPVSLPYPINTNHSECCAVYGKDGELFFSSDRTGDWSIYRAVLTSEGYEVSLLSGNINSSEDEWPSHYIEDHGALLLSSIRETGAGGDDVYISPKTENGWSKPVLLQAGVNSSGYEDTARVFGETLYWSSRRNADGSPGDVSNIFSIQLACVASIEH